MDVSKLYERAQSAVERNNLDYAVDLFQQILAIEPNFVMARKAIRAVQHRQVQQTGFGTPAKIIGVLKGIPSLVKIIIFKMTKNHEYMMMECEKFLTGFPTNIFVLTSLAQSASLAKYADSAIACYEAIAEIDKKNVNALKNLGRLYASKNEITKAQHFYNEVTKVRPNDMEADRAVRDLAALGTIKGSWDQGGSDGDFKKVMKDEGETEKLEAENKILRTADDVDKAIERVKEEIEKKPGQGRLWADLGDLHLRKNDFAAAKAAYDEIAKIDISDPTAALKMGDLEIRKYNVHIKKLQGQAAKKPGDAALKQSVAKMQKQKLAYSIKEYARRVAAQPTELTLRMDYGKLLYSANKVDEALSEFQKAVENPKHRKSAIIFLGQCFMKKKMYDLAIAQFEKGTSEITMMDEEAKVLLYNLGVACEGAGKLDKAHDCFKRIYETDIGFKDVSEKIESVYRKAKEEKEANAN